jgi:hypothetical protein
MPDLVGHPAAIGVDKAAEQPTWITIDDAPLPRFERDPAFVLSSSCVLWEEMRQCWEYEPTSSRFSRLRRYTAVLLAGITMLIAASHSATING